MNILYISHLTDAISEGPNYSVPAQIKAQSKYDSVFWWNLTSAKQQCWLDTGLFHGIEEYQSKKISDLPKPFDKPDLVVFESFYYVDDALLSRECRRRKIPYVVVPRSALTKQGQSRKRIKKLLANILLFKPMTKHASAIHYLTEKELSDSGKSWCKNAFVIGNGIERKPFKTKERGSVIRGVYIGRFEPVQKGLDLLLDACVSCKKSMQENNVVIELYGPKRYNCREEYREQILQKDMGELIKIREGVFGTEKQSVLENADFFVMTSRFEGMPMSLIEAMSYGLPCLITDGTNMTDVVERFDAGWTARVDTNSISEALTRMIKDIPEFERKQQNAWELSKQYDWDAIASNTHEKYEQLLMQRR